MKIGEILKSQRELKGYSQTEVSKLTGMSISNVSKIETGRLNGTLEIVNKLLDCYGLESVEQSIEKQIEIENLVSLLTDLDNQGFGTVSISLVLNKLNK
jgi:transcriptional regulator with XRE-family HTH domain